MGFVHKIWSGGYRTYLDGDNVRLARAPRKLCFSRVEARSLGFGFGFGFHFFADVLAPASSRCSFLLTSFLPYVFRYGGTISVLASRCSLLCSSLLTSFLPHVFRYHFDAGITVSLFFALDIGGRHDWYRLLADAEPVHFNQSSAFIHSCQTLPLFHRTSNQCTRR
jgi:hypothetical protein